MEKVKSFVPEDMGLPYVVSTMTADATCIARVSLVMVCTLFQ